mgnify:CR=1 FL=1
MAHRGWENSGEEKVTVRGRLIIEDRFALAKLLYTMRIFRDAVEMAYRLMKKEGLKPEETTKRVARFISNAHYAYSAIKRAMAYLDQGRLNLKKPQLYSIGKGCEKGNRNIRLVSVDKVLIKIPHANGRHGWLEAKVKFHPRHVPLIEELIRQANNGMPYSASIVLSKGKYYLHLHIPLELYAKHTTKVRVSTKARLIAGFDINPDRMCMIIVDTNGHIRDVKTKHFPEVTLAGFPKNKTKDLRLKALSELIDYACHHNVKYFVFEKIRKIPKGKMKTKSASRKVTRFAYAELLQHAKVMVKKRNGIFIQMNPAYTSVDAIPLSRKLGLDVHTTSVYLLALRYLNL